MGIGAGAPGPDEHAPAAQVWPALHARPHAPQFLASLASVASHPFDETASQSPKPALQVNEHAPALQRGAALVAPGHAEVLDPRPSALHVRRVVASEQSTAPGTHESVTHAPAEHA